VDNFDHFVLGGITSHHIAAGCVLGCGVGGGAWAWRRELWVWEEGMLGEFPVLLHDFTLQVQVPDVWQWLHVPPRGYSVSGAYQLSMSR
jgi:hypothetical protein